jgi:RNA polymerase sigma-70 factor (ECF subfamily)
MSIEEQGLENKGHKSQDFAALTSQHKDPVYRRMIRVCGNREDPEDVLVEALLKAYRHLDQLRDSAAFRAWLAQIAKRVCWQLKERESLLPLLQLSTLKDEGREISGNEPTPEAGLARRQMKQLLDDAIAALPPLYRLVYRLRDLEDPAGRRSRTGTQDLESRHEVATASRPRFGQDSSRCGPQS